MADDDQSGWETAQRILDGLGAEAIEVTQPGLIEDGDDSYLDLGLCPYLFRWYSLPGSDPNAVCAFGCRDEPECMTCEPDPFWPSWAPLIALWWAMDHPPFFTGPVSTSVTRYLREADVVAGPVGEIAGELHAALGLPDNLRVEFDDRNQP